MKPLSLSQPLVIMIVGKPGAGKSFFAKQFSETFGAPIIGVDRLSYEIGPGPEQEVERITDNLLTYQFEELLKTKRTILIDGGCNSRVSRQKLNRLAKSAGYGSLVVWVQTDDSTCELRATKRNPKRVEDKFNLSLEPERFAVLAKRFTAPTREDYIVISGRHTYNTQAKTVLRKLTTPREALTRLPQPEQRAVPKTDDAQADQTRRSVIIR